RRHDLHGHQRAEGVRHRVRHGQRGDQRHGGHRRAHDPVVLHQQPRRSRCGDRRHPVHRHHPGDDLERPPVPPTGGDAVTLTAPLPTEVEATPAPSRADEGPVGGHRGGWFTRITIAVVVVLWLIPTLGVLVTSFRPEALVRDTGWWTVLTNPFDTSEWTLENYRLALDTGGFENAFLNSLAVTLPATVIPITIAAFAAYAFSWMEFRGRYVMFVLVVG